MAARQPFYSTFTEYGEPDYSPSIQYNPKGLPVHSAQLLPLKLPFLPSFIDSDIVDSDAGDDDELTAVDSEQPSPFGAYALFELVGVFFSLTYRTFSRGCMANPSIDRIDKKLTTCPSRRAIH